MLQEVLHGCLQVLLYVHTYCKIQGNENQKKINQNSHIST